MMERGDGAQKWTEKEMGHRNGQRMKWNTEIDREGDGAQKWTQKEMGHKNGQRRKWGTEVILTAETQIIVKRP
jgi:hypothetical protein